MKVGTLMYFGVRMTTNRLTQKATNAWALCLAHHACECSKNGKEESIKNGIDCPAHQLAVCVTVYCAIAQWFEVCIYVEDSNPYQLSFPGT